MPVILCRCLLNVMYHSEYIISIENLYALYKLFDLPSVFGVSYLLYSLMKFLIKQAFVWAWNTNEIEWPAILNNPGNIHAAVTFQQIDTIEFKSPHLYIIIGILLGMISEMLDYGRMLEPIKQWYYTIITAHAQAFI